MKRKIISDKNIVRHLVQSSISSKYQDGYIRTFHCIRCGHHPLAIHQLWMRDDGENMITRVIFFDHNGPKEITKTGSLSNVDGESMSMVSCGRCGIPGYIENIPKMLTEDDDLDMALELVNN